ncbi:MAG: hypothetical protein U1D67_00375 [Dehalococcoidia bacterium]|nr:hypothetical protein [Dehalococcoidia bacterium]MDZ4245555.1 hypothetical protein [Dehalococcoidia bacterium]
MVKKNKHDKISLVMHDGAWDKVNYGLSIAVAALSSGKEVHAMFTYGALKRLIKGRADEMGGETSEEIRNRLQGGAFKGKLATNLELLRIGSQMGLKIYACPAAMAVLGISREQLIPEADSVVGLMGFLEISLGSSLTYYI